PSQWKSVYMGAGLMPAIAKHEGVPVARRRGVTQSNDSAGGNDGTDPPRDPLLQRRPLTDEELEREAEVTEADIEAAIASFNQHAPLDARGLLEAEPID